MPPSSPSSASPIGRSDGSVASGAHLPLRDGGCRGPRRYAAARGGNRRLVSGTCRSSGVMSVPRPELEGAGGGGGRLVTAVGFVVDASARSPREWAPKVGAVVKGYGQRHRPA